MKCSKCQFENREGVKFCQECGDKLQSECPACKTKLPLGKKFCGECGYELIEIQEIPAISEGEGVRAGSELLLEKIDNASTTHRQRLKIGDRLAEIGDPRPGVGLRGDGLPHFVWCEVLGGKITLEKTGKTFTVDPFYISKYPVTWIQYRSFLEAEDGYRCKKWWAGLAKRQDEPGEQYRKLDNHPAEKVSWYDAVAYCRWLSERLDYEILLPSEWEWQQAATGGDPTNKYPWGRKWDSDRANTDESGLSRTTAVGLYPHGTSPVEAFDMSGNILEWCLNEYENPRMVEVTGDSDRALRGGSWYDFWLVARCAFRGVNDPDFRDDTIGFRLMCSSSHLLNH